MDDIIRLIVIEESANDAEIILNSLRKARFPIRPRHIEDHEDLQIALNDQTWDLLITVPQVGDMNAEQVCETIKAAKQDIPVIVLASKLEPKIFANILNAGAKHIIPSNNDICLQAVVNMELTNLSERRKRKQLEQLYRESQRHNKMLLETSRDAIAYVHDGMHIYANPSYLEMFTFKSLDELEGLPVMDLVIIDDQPKFKEFMRDYMTDDKLMQGEKQIDLRGIKADHKAFKLRMEVSQAIFDSERCIQIIIRDQSQSQELERKLKEASLRDALTGLYNRAYFLKLVETAMAKSVETASRSTILYIGFDNFLSGKIGVGVANSDIVIKNVGEVVKNTVGEEGTVARFADTVLTVLLPDKEMKFASEMAEKLCKAIESSVTDLGNGESILTTASIGIAPVLTSAKNSQEVLADAQNASMTAFQKGGNTFEIYKAVIKTEPGNELKVTDIAKMIETAIEENRLSLRYQPIVSLHGDTHAYYDIFLRMVDANGENIPAGKLFSAAEQANLTTQLDKWVLKEAVKMLMKQSQLGRKMSFFIKLSDLAVKDETILLYIRKLLKSTQLSGEHLIFEMSEALAISQVRLAKAFVNSLKVINCLSALEHFGTGLNSATTLKHIPIDFVKIDSSFSKNLSTNNDSQNTVKEIVKLAKEMQKQTIAESVEDANSLQILWSCGVDFVQGHYISEPLEEPSYDFSEE